MHSADCIGLGHAFTPEDISSWIQSLVGEVGEDALNIKMLLMGGNTKESSQLFIFPLAPLFPKRSWYRDGISICSFVYERWMPQAKTLNMLPSYYYYTHAKAEGHYDALLVDRDGALREGTRTNIYGMKGNSIFSPPKEDVLEGVTMMTLEHAIQNSIYTLQYKKIPYISIQNYDSVFLSSTSTKIIPVREVDGREFKISQELRGLIELYNEALDRSHGLMKNI